MPLSAGHIGINVTNLERSRDFYTSILDLEPIGGSDQPPRRFAFLGDGERLLLTLWEQSDGRFDASRPGLHHLSFQVGTIDEVHTAETRLVVRGAKVVYVGVVPHREGAHSGG